MVPGAINIISAARSHRGLEEDPRGSNDGENLRQVLRQTAFKPGESWCMYFAVTCVIEGYGGLSHLPRPLLNTGSCQDAADFAKKQGRLSLYPATGCIFVLPNSAGHFHHAGIVQSVDEERAQVRTIEGNTNTDGSPNGYGVFEHVRRIQSLRYIVWEQEDLR